MSDYLVSGKKGAGKSIFCIGIIREALLAGKRVATNLDINIDKLLPVSSKAVIVRIPDRPTYDDMVVLGKGQLGVAEEDNGVIVFDEASAFLNSRSWNDKTRQPFLDWLIHSRKYGWDTYFIAQGQEQLDKQLRTTQLEYHVAVKNTGKWPIPLLSPLALMLFNYKLFFPKIHIGIIRQGMERDAFKVSRRWFLGRDLYPAYDTQQVFLDRDNPSAVGIHTLLSCYHLKGRYLNWFDMHKKQIFILLFLGIFIGSGLGFSAANKISDLPQKEEIVFDAELKIIGLVQEGLILSAYLSDGRVLPVSGHRLDAHGVEIFKVDGKWLKK